MSVRGNGLTALDNLEDNIVKVATSIGIIWKGDGLDEKWFGRKG